MADYEYYVNCYMGCRIPQREFSGLARRAQAYLEQLERTFLVVGGQDAKAMAVCAMAEELHTLQYVLYNTLTSMTDLETLKNGGGATVAPQSLKMAITVITVVPVMFVYPFLQKHFVSGIMVGSVKA